MFQIVAAINDAGVEEGGGFLLGGGLPRAARVLADGHRRSQRDRHHPSGRFLAAAVVPSRCERRWPSGKIIAAQEAKLTAKQKPSALPPRASFIAAARSGDELAKLADTCAQNLFTS